MANRLDITRPVYEAPILDWIPARYHNAIRGGTSAVDASGYVKDAIEECASTGDRLIVMPGTYGWATAQTLGGVCQILGGGATFKLLSNLASNNYREAMLRWNASAPSIDRLSFNLGSFNGSAIFLQNTVSAEVTRVNVSNIKAGYAALRGGGNLYTRIVSGTLSGNGRGLDMQLGWDEAPGGRYYGMHHTRVDQTVFIVREGNRFHGKTGLHGTDHEHGIYTPVTTLESGTPKTAAIVLGDEIASAALHQYSLYDCYAECAEGTVGKMILFDGAVGSVTKLFGNELRGAGSAIVGGTAFRQVGLAHGSCYVGNTIVAWETCFDAANQGSSTDPGLLDLNNNFVPSPTVLYKAGTGQQPGENPRAPGAYYDLMHDQIGGYFRGIGQRDGIVTINPNTTTNKIDLSQAPVFEITSSVARTLDYTYLAGFSSATAPVGNRGNVFTLMFMDGSTTLANTTFNLKGAANKTYSAGQCVRLRIDSTGKISEEWN